MYWDNSQLRIEDFIFPYGEDDSDTPKTAYDLGYIFARLETTTRYVIGVALLLMNLMKGCVPF